MGILKRYRELLPLTAATPDVNLEEGSTPLIPQAVGPYITF